MTRSLSSLVAVPFLCFGMLPVVAGAGTALVPADRDNTLFESVDGSISDGAGPAMFAGKNSASNMRRTVVRFDVAGCIPAGSTIVAVELRLHVSSAADSVAHAITVHRVLRDWGEGSSNAGGGNGAPAQPGDATWLHRFFPDSFWDNAGGDFDALPHGATLVGDPADYVWFGPNLVADVQGWLDAPETNFGWLLRGDESVPKTARRIDTRENADAAVRPALYVEYSTPTGAGVDQDSPSWARFKASYR